MARPSILVGLPFLALAGVFSGASLSSGCATSSQAYFLEAGADDGAIGAAPGVGADGGDTSVDGGVFGDGGPGAPGVVRVACGTSACRADQKCVDNACTNPCVGTKIPGDYATVTAAVTALAATGADITLCLGSLNTSETVTIADPASHNKSLTIVGTSPAHTLGSVSVGAGFGDVTLVGLRSSSALSVRGASKVTLRGLKLSVSSGVALEVRAQSGSSSSSVLVDGCDIGSTGASAYGVYVDASSSSSLNVSVVNSYIHGGSYGVYWAGTNAAASLRLVNNTIDKANNGISISAAATAPVSYFNNIISGSSGVAINLGSGMTALTHSNNALFGNTTNYSGAAVDGAGYIKQDCQFDMSTGVPQTKAGSPCRGVGKAEGAPPNDYWNVARGAKIDLGAVQGP